MASGNDSTLEHHGHPGRLQQHAAVVAHHGQPCLRALAVTTLFGRHLAGSP